VWLLTVGFVHFFLGGHFSEQGGLGDGIGLRRQQRRHAVAFHVGVPENT
jgi:hypothetical protein